MKPDPIRRLTDINSCGQTLKINKEKMHMTAGEWICLSDKLNIDTIISSAGFSRLRCWIKYKNTPRFSQDKTASSSFNVCSSSQTVVALLSADRHKHGKNEAHSFQWTSPPHVLQHRKVTVMCVWQGFSRNNIMTVFKHHLLLLPHLNSRIYE